VYLQRRLDRVGRCEDIVKLFKSRALSFGHHEVPCDELYRVPYHENNVGLPSNIGAVAVLVIPDGSLRENSTYREMGHANWLSNPPNATDSDEKAMPLARISKERTSTG